MTVLVLAFIAVLLVGWLLACQDKLTEWDEAQSREEELRGQVQDKKAQAINLDLYKQQRDEMSQSFAALLKQLPDKTEVKELLVEVNQAGLGRGMQFELFKPGKEVRQEFYATLPITVDVNGVYHDLGAFASDIAKLSRIVTLNNLAISPIGGRRLRMGIELRTFRYLSDEEVAAQAQAGGRK
jgi:type IV pilus assembly protein PilO